MDISISLNVMMARRKVSQKKLSEMVGVTSSYMSSLCNNKRIPSTGLLKKISEALECELSELIAEGE